MEKKAPLEIMRDVLKLEAQALENSAAKINEEQASQLLSIFEELKSQDGHLIFCGVGKSGLIGKKLASTFCSVGLPSFALHPTEALHGDLGRLRTKDALVYISKSGTTEEIVKLSPFLDIPKERIIGLVGNANSPIAQYCGLVFDCSVEKEACLNNQAPTTSTTVALGLGDAMAVLFEDMIGLSKENFAINHPGGLLGKSLRIKVQDLMVEASQCPILHEEATLKEALIEMTDKPLGGCAVLSEKKEFLGVIVEGDIRRTLTSKATGVETKLKDIMNAKPISVQSDELASQALLKMEDRAKPLNILPVVDHKEFKGFLRLHDLLKEGFSLSKKSSPS